MFLVCLFYLLGLIISLILQNNQVSPQINHILSSFISDLHGSLNLEDSQKVDTLTARTIITQSLTILSKYR